MNKGDYVRNCYGRIAKIEYIEDNVAYCDNWLTQQYEEHIDFIHLDDEEDLDEIIKSSPNIIDILEVGDYVNGEEVIDIKNGKIYFENYSEEPENIETIVTHEQFSAMEYKVESEVK